MYIFMWDRIIIHISGSFASRRCLVSPNQIRTTEKTHTAKGRKGHKKQVNINTVNVIRETSRNWSEITHTQCSDHLQWQQRQMFHQQDPFAGGLEATALWIRNKGRAMGSTQSPPRPHVRSVQAQVLYAVSCHHTNWDGKHTHEGSMFDSKSYIPCTIFEILMMPY